MRPEPGFSGEDRAHRARLVMRRRDQFMRDAAFPNTVAFNTSSP
jgi:hypothetical protein